jgi:hypothetical protein
MKWLLVLLLVVIAVVLAFIGVLASADPEGRGAHAASILFGCALAVLVMAVSLSMYLW